MSRRFVSTAFVCDYGLHSLDKIVAITLFSKANAAFTVPCTAFYSLKQDKLYDTEGTALVVSHRAAIPFWGKKNHASA